MKAFRFLAIFVSVAVLTRLTVEAQTTETNTTTIIGQWDFETNDLTVATVGMPLQFLGGYSPEFVQVPIGGRLAGAMSFNAATATEGILARIAPTNNGGGANLNLYTVIMDIMWPAASEGTWRGLLNTETNNNTDADMFIDPDGRLGVLNNYAGRINVSEWYRLALVFNLTNNTVTRYLNGTNAAGTNEGGMFLAGGNTDGRFSLKDGILFFSDDDGETAPGLVSVIQLRAGVMTDEEVFALGGAGASGLGEGGAPVGDVTIKSITREGNNIVITVANNGRTIQLEKTPTLVNSTWTAEGVATTQSTFSVPMALTHEFFRVKIIN